MAKIRSSYTQRERPGQWATIIATTDDYYVVRWADDVREILPRDDRDDYEFRDVNLC